MIELKALQGRVKDLVDDLRRQIAADEYADLRSSLKAEHAKAKDAQRTAGTFETWLEDVLDQAAVAWVLGCVFVRFCEDNGLIKKIWIGGPTEAAPAERAVQERQGYLIANPLHNDRHWLREAFTYMAGLGPTAKIFDEHNPVWRFAISGAAAERLSDFFRRGDGYASLESPGLNTRFLGDLYQNLSAHARETYALLQTPEFVEEFILDRTFEPAYKEFGLAGTTVIDPTCGSGHFLLGAFDRLITRWKKREPNTEANVLVQRALDQVTGVDINPFAVAIARFRLMIAALNACDKSDLEAAPAFNLRLATGDSLLRWGRSSSIQGELPTGGGKEQKEDEEPFAYYSEDFDELGRYLRANQYAVVVGNPPYITVKDKALNETYRKLYSACSGKYALTIPFAQLFFRLAKRGDHDGLGAGHVGQITANSFMKREFGKKLINEFFAGEVELTEVIDTSGAYIPGHGTPTVIVVGCNRFASPRYSGPIRAILGVRGEPSQPDESAKGQVWSALVAQVDNPGTTSAWVTSADLDRPKLSSYPWSLSGGGASALLEQINSAPGRLGDLTEHSGFVAITAEDDAFFRTLAAASRSGIEVTRPMITGDVVRDFGITPDIACIFPYGEDLQVLAPAEIPTIMRQLWPNRRVMERRKRFGTYIEDIPSLRWYEFGELYREKLRTPLSIGFAFVATHNHFVLDRGGKVFKQSAPVIKLPEGAKEDDHLGLLGVLNSSTACFWLKQVSQPKAGGGVGRGMQDEAWEERYEFTGTKLAEFPLPSDYPLDLSRKLDGLARKLAAISPQSIAAAGMPTKGSLGRARVEWESLRCRMIALQEELDWKVYKLYGLVDEDLTVVDPPELHLGERAFEIVMARVVKDGKGETQWFSRHDSEPVIELPKHWPSEYRKVVERRIEIIESNRHIALIEQPVCKRRWSMKKDKLPWDWAAQQTAALQGWLLDRLEASELWGGAPVPLSLAQLADRVRHDEDFRSVLDLWVGSDQHDLTKTLGKLVADEHVPYLPPLRYKAAGLRKRVQWERTWELQRQEDAGNSVTIDVPPKYVSGDFQKASYWRNRGKLDVPKERFVSYPNMGRDGDATLLLGWAGWDHLAQAQAIATVYLDRKNVAGWKKEDGLLSLLAGLAEWEPWLKQWFDEPRAGFPGSPARFFTGFIDTELATFGADRTDLDKLRFEPMVR